MHSLKQLVTYSERRVIVSEKAEMFNTAFMYYAALQSVKK